MSSSVNALNDSTTTVSTTGSTSNGTKIVTSTGGSMDKTAFLKILAAELSNLDPTQDQDSTAYVTQMAQFASIEQMTNLNSTMTKFAYDQLVGKGVTMTDTDSSGNAITGIVKAVSTDSSGNTYLYLSIDGSSDLTAYNASNIASIIDSSETTTSNSATTALNTSFLAASSLKGSDVVVSTTDTDDTDNDDNTTETIEVSGTVKSVYIENGVVMIKITTEDGTTEEYPYSSVTKTSDSESSTTSSTTTA